MSGYFWPIAISCAAYLLTRSCNPSFILPYLYLLTPFRESAYNGWKNHAHEDTSIHYGLRPIPEILASEYTYESMVTATAGFSRPAVIRGLFNDSRAAQYWNSREYLSDKFGDVKIPVVRDGLIGTLQNDRFTEQFGSAYRRIFDSNDTKEYLFFPAKSRFSFPGVEQNEANRLEVRGNEILRQDLDLSRIRPGMGDPKDRYFVTGQFVIGKAPADPTAARTGSDFHCAGANNWFVQVGMSRTLL